MVSQLHVVLIRDLLVAPQLHFLPVHDRIRVNHIRDLTGANAFCAVMYARNMHIDRVDVSWFSLGQFLSVTRLLAMHGQRTET